MTTQESNVMTSTKLLSEQSSSLNTKGLNKKKMLILNENFLSLATKHKGNYNDARI